MLRALFSLAALAVTGCATVRGGETLPAGQPVLQVTYATGACFGTCPVYSVTVDLAAGDIAWRGERFVAVAGERRLTDKGAVAAFLNRLQKWRPAGERLLTGSPECATMATDLPTVDVRWSGIAGPAHLAFNYGCDGDRNKALADALRTAPTLLPIADLIGRR